MTGSNSWLKPVVYPPLDAAGLAEIRQRVADGIFLGGDYRAAYEQYLIAHRDRVRLLERLDLLEKSHGS